MLRLRRRFEVFLPPYFILLPNTDSNDNAAAREEAEEEEERLARRRKRRERHERHKRERSERGEREPSRDERRSRRRKDKVDDSESDSTEDEYDKPKMIEGGPVMSGGLGISEGGKVPASVASNAGSKRDRD